MDAEHISVGSVTLTATDDGRLAISHVKQPVRVVIDAAKLERWLLRILRDETFKPAAAEV